MLKKRHYKNSGNLSNKILLLKGTTTIQRLSRRLSVLWSFFKLATMFKLHAMFRRASYTTVHDMLIATFLELLWCITCCVFVYGMLIAYIYLNASILPQHLSIAITTPQLNHILSIVYFWQDGLRGAWITKQKSLPQCKYHFKSPILVQIRPF